MNSIIPLVARIFISFIFIMSGIKKSISFIPICEDMAVKGLPMPELLLVAAIGFLIVGGLSVLFGYKAKVGAFILIVFLVPTTFIYHFDIGNLIPDIQLMKNIGLIGGLLMIVAFGSGKLSIKQ